MRFTPFLILLAAPATAQIASEDFESGNTDSWGVEFVSTAPHFTTGGNPDGRIEVTIQSSQSQLPAAMIVPAGGNHPWRGNFRTLGVTNFSFDRQVEAGSSNFGTLPFLVLGNDGGTPTDFLDDAWAFVYTNDSFQFGFSPWTTVSTPIPSSEVIVPANWDVAALPNSPLNGSSNDAIWDAIIQDVDYVGIAMSRPFNGGAWFGAHMISMDNFVLDGVGTIGTRYCDPAVPNSTGAPAVLDALGTAVVSVNDVTLQASSVPANAFGFFLTSQMQGFTANPGGSEGNLCLGGMIGRYVGPGQIQNSGSGGSFSLPLDLTMTPTPTGLVPVAAGETWNFQAWHRDMVAGASTSNFTDALSITFQ